MKNLLRVAAYEYRRNVFKRSFIFTLLSIPLFIAFSIGIGLLMESQGDNSQPVGIVDHAQVFSEPLFPAEDKANWIAQYSEPVEFIAYNDEQQARAALDANELQAYFILPEDYMQNRQMEVVYVNEPGENAWQQWWDLLQLNLMVGQPSDIARRVASGTEYIVRSIDGTRQAPTSAPTFGLLMPLFIAAAFLLMMMMSAGYTLGAVADEKENRTMEILVTTISPIQLIGGKIIGIVAISLTLLISWTVIVLLGVVIGRQAGVSWLNDLSMDWRTVIATVTIAIPSYVLVTALMTTIGVMVTTVQEGQSVSAIFFILHAIPFYASWLFISNPHSPLAILMSLLPFTSLMTVGMRNLFTIVPTWQVAISVVVQTLGALGAIWLASTAFRTGMLRYGQRLSFRRLIASGSRE
jgi:ABC-2 type transport system permease protein